MTTEGKAVGKNYNEVTPEIISLYVYICRKQKESTKLQIIQQRIAKLLKSVLSLQRNLDNYVLQLCLCKEQYSNSFVAIVR